MVTSDAVESATDAIAADLMVTTDAVESVGDPTIRIHCRCLGGDEFVIMKVPPVAASVVKQTLDQEHGFEKSETQIFLMVAGRVTGNGNGPLDDDHLFTGDAELAVVVNISD